MRIGGKEIKGPNIETLILPRGDDVIVFKAQAVLSMDEFEATCPAPKAPKVRSRREGLIDDVNNPTYKTLMNDYGSKRMAYMVIKSLEATPDLQWDTVDIDDSDTWTNYSNDLTNAGFSMIEVGRILNLVLEANCLSDKRLDEARESFLRGEAADETLSSQMAEAQTI